jgi:carboxymethylenebutenolidase
MNTLRQRSSLLAALFALLLSAPAFAGTATTVVLHSDSTHSFRVYVNGPENAPRGILVVHGWWGLTDQVKAGADQFAALGYRAMAIDLYDGRVATTPDKARSYMNSVEQAEANRKFRAALKALQKPGRKVAAMGWSFGATQALQATLADPGTVAATVMYYPHGIVLKPGNDLASLRGSVLVLRARMDSPSNIKETTRFIQAAKKLGKSVVEHTYDAKHGFANPAVKHYNAHATDAAWRRTTDFLDAQLK